MFPFIDRLRQQFRHAAERDPETEALNQAVDRFEVEMIHRRFARQNRGRNGY